MKPKEIRDLIDFISTSGLDEVNIETPEFKLSVKKNSTVVAQIAESPVVVQSSIPQQVVAAEAQAQAVAASPVVAKSNLVEIKSPMIGTFYNSAGPNAQPFVNVGDPVKAGQTVCIIEAMKLFNEIESEYSGKIVKVLAENATPVEYDQPLYLVDPS